MKNSATADPTARSKPSKSAKTATPAKTDKPAQAVKTKKTATKPKEVYPKLSPWAKEVKKRLEKLGKALAQ